MPVPKRTVGQNYLSRQLNQFPLIMYRFFGGLKGDPTNNNFPGVFKLVTSKNVICGSLKWTARKQVFPWRFYMLAARKTLCCCSVWWSRQNILQNNRTNGRQQPILLKNKTKNKKATKQTYLGRNKKSIPHIRLNIHI